MGIEGLLSFFQPLTRKDHISTFKNMRIGVDAMCYLYKAWYNSFLLPSLTIDQKKFTGKLKEMIDLLYYYNIHPIFVFDGRSLPFKRDTIEKRSKTKDEYKEKGEQCMKAERFQEARKHFSKCIVIDESIITLAIRYLNMRGVEILFAPYQADSQLVKLRRIGIIDTIISEDSDLLVYGTNVIFKITPYGQCDYIDLNLHKPQDINNTYLKDFLSFSLDKRIDSMVLAGTDYHPSIKGIGIKRAITYLRQHQTIEKVVEKLIKNPVYTQHISPEYVTIVNKVRLIFMFATTYNPLSKTLQLLDLQRQTPTSLSQLQLLAIVGSKYDYDERVSKGIIIARTLQPRTLEKLQIQQTFYVDKDKLLINQVANQKRRQDQQRIKQQHKKQNQLLATLQQNDDKVQEVLQVEQKTTPEKRKGLCKQEKQKKHQERINQFHKLTNLMASVMEQIDNNSQLQKQNNVQTSQKMLQQQQSPSNDQLAILNPFLRSSTSSCIQIISTNNKVKKNQ